MDKEQLVQKISKVGGNPYWVGGCVRDPLLGRPARDLDLIVFNLTAERLEAALSSLGSWKKYGKVQPVWAISGIPVEISISGQSLMKDAKTRDFTLNAIYRHAINNRLEDPLRGFEDLKKRVLRMAGPYSFQRDPLRVYRSFQLASRFHLTIEKNTLLKMKETDIGSIPMERIYEEYKKWILAPFPELGYGFMKATGLMIPILEGIRAMDLEMQLKKWVRYREQSDSPELFMWSLLQFHRYPILFDGKPFQSLAETEKKKRCLREIRHSFYALSRHHQKSVSLEQRVKALDLLTKANRPADFLRMALLFSEEEMTLFAEALEMGDKIRMIRSYWPQNPPNRKFNGKKLKKLGIPAGPQMGVWMETIFQLQLEGVGERDLEIFVQKNRHLFK